MTDAPSDIRDALRTALQRAGKDFLSLTEVRTRLPMAALSALNLSRGASAGEVADAVSPHLEPDLILHHKGRSGYIGRPLNVILINILDRKPGKSIKALVALKLPADKAAVVAAVNEGLQSGRFRCAFNVHYTPSLFLADAPPPAASDAPRPPREAPVGPGDEAADRRAFRAAYEAVGRGRSFVSICRLRRHLGWPRERFDAVLSRLSRDLVVQLQGGDPSAMDEADIRDSFIDDRGRLRIAVTWRKPS